MYVCNVTPSPQVIYPPWPVTLLAQYAPPAQVYYLGDLITIYFCAHLLDL